MFPAQYPRSGVPIEGRCGQGEEPGPVDSLAVQLDAFLEGVAERADPTTMAVIRHAADQMLADCVADRSLRVGDQAPDFTLPDKAGHPVALYDVLARGPVVLTFFRGGWCPFCTISLRALARIHPALRRRGAEVLAISPQPRHACESTAHCSALPYPVLSDHDNRVARSYGVAVTLPPDLQKAYCSLGHDLPTINGVPGWELPMPSGFVVAPDARIVLARVDPRAHKRLEPNDALAAVEALAAAR